VAASCRSAARNWRDPSRRSSDYGYRVAQTPSGIPKSPEADSK
jgi:hypothetical protein